MSAVNPGAAGFGITSPFAYGPVRSQLVGIDATVANILSRKIPGDRIERLRAFSVVVTTSGAAGTRTAVFRFRNGDGGIMVEITGGATQAASLTKRYTFLLGYGALIGDVSGDLTVPLPEFYLEPGFAWEFAIANPQAGDAMASQVAVADVFPGDAYAYPLVGVIGG